MIGLMEERFGVSHFYASGVPFPFERYKFDSKICLRKGDKISKTIAGMAAFDGLLGVSLFVFTGTIRWTINLLHLVVSLAVITQASSAATAYDM